MAAERPPPWPPPTVTGHAPAKDRVLQNSQAIKRQASIIVEMINLLAAKSSSDHPGLSYQASQGKCLMPTTTKESTTASVGSQMMLNPGQRPIL